MTEIHIPFNQVVSKPLIHHVTGLEDRRCVIPAQAGIQENTNAIAYRDVGKGREQDAEALPTGT